MGSGACGAGLGDTHCLCQFPYGEWAEPVDGAEERILRGLDADAEFLDHLLRVCLQAFADAAEAAAEA